MTIWKKLYDRWIIVTKIFLEMYFQTIGYIKDFYA